MLLPPTFLPAIRRSWIWKIKIENLQYVRRLKRVQMPWHFFFFFLLLSFPVHFNSLHVTFQSFSKNFPTHFSVFFRSFPSLSDTFLHISYILLCIYIYYRVDVVEWSRALDVRLSEWCCSVSMVWVQIPSREEQKIVSSKI